MSKSRIYLELSTSVLKSDKKTMYYLTYLKIRNYATNHGGRFFISDFSKVCGLSLPTTKKHIKELLRLEWIVCNKNGSFSIKSQRGLLNKANRHNFYSISEETLNTFSWRNISAFKALLMVMVDAKFKQTQRAIIKGFKVRNQKDKITEQIKDASLGAWNTFMACNLTADLISKNKSTVSRYRKKQNFVKYTSKMSVFNNFAFNEAGESLLNDFKRDEYKGRFFFHKGTCYFSPISIINFNNFKLSAK